MPHASTPPLWNDVQDGPNPLPSRPAPGRARPAPGMVVVSVEPFALWAHRWDRTLRDDAAPDAARNAAPLACSDDGQRVAYADGAARAAGVEAGMSVAGARQRAPDLVVLPAAGPEIDAAWETFLNDLLALSPRVAPLRTGVAALAGDARDAEQAAERLGGRVGAAATIEEAWLLAYLAEPGRARAVAPDDDPWRLLDPAPAYLLGGLGLSPASRERLAWLGVDTIGALRRWTGAQLLAYLGEEGRALAPALHGPRRDRLPYRPPPDVIAVDHAFDDPAREPAELEPVLRRLVDDAAHRLGERSAERLRIVVAAAGLRSDATRRAKAPLRDPIRLARLARHALADTGLTPLGIEELRLELSGLARRATPGELWAQRRRRYEAARAVHARFPGQARAFALHDPDGLRARLRWRLHDLASGDPLPWDGPAPRALANDDGARIVPAPATKEALRR